MQSLEIIVSTLYVMGAGGYQAYLFLQKDHFQKIGYYLLITGFGLHCVSLIYKVILTGYIPVNNLHETLFIAGWALVGVFFIFRYKYNLKVLGVYAAPLAALIVVSACLLQNEPGPPREIFNHFWLVFHIIAIFTGEASFALACGIGMLYLLQERSIKTKRPGFFFKRLPSLELLDATGHACIVAGFTLLTIGLITGFIYARVVWGRFWSWDPKEVFSGITWMMYAALLHVRFSVGWRGRKAAVLAIIGFGALLFTFLGVNFFFDGHHVEFTKY